MVGEGPGFANFGMDFDVLTEGLLTVDFLLVLLEVYFRYLKIICWSLALLKGLLQGSDQPHRFDVDVIHRLSNEPRSLSQVLQGLGPTESWIDPVVRMFVDVCLKVFGARRSVGSRMVFCRFVIGSIKRR